MPRRGGDREGTVGGQYENRSDLRKPKLAAVPTGQPYGANKAMTEQRQAIPLPDPGSPPPSPVVPLNAPTQRPDEPLTAGLPIGPGPGPSVPVTPDPATIGLGALLSMKSLPPDLAHLRDQLQATISNRNAP